MTWPGDLVRFSGPKMKHWSGWCGLVVGVAGGTVWIVWSNPIEKKLQLDTCLLKTLQNMLMRNDDG